MLKTLTQDFPGGELQRVLHRASAAPFYQRYLSFPIDATPALWAELPLTTKEHLREAYPTGMLASPWHEVATYHESSGTSGTPTASFLTENDWQDVYLRFLRNGAGVNVRDLVLVKTPYALATTAHQMHGAARLAGAGVVPADNRSSNISYAKVIRLLKDLPITLTWSLPTETILWAEAAKLAGLNPRVDFPHLRALIVAGEPLSPAKKRAIAKLWGKPVFQDYGSTETGTIASDCSFGRLHLWTDRLYCELVVEPQDAERDPESGFGSLVITPLSREAMPLVRFDTGDEIAVNKGACPCGLTQPTIQVVGRRGGGLPLPSGNLQASDLEDCIYAFPVMLWRGRKVGLRQLEIEIAVNSRSELCQEELCHEELSDELAHAVFRRHGVYAEVRIVPRSRLIRDELLRGSTTFQKPRFIFDEHENWDEAIAYT